MDEQEFVEYFMSIFAFAIFFILAIVGALVSALNPDSYQFINFDPPEDLMILSGLLIFNFFILIYMLLQALKFKTSRNLNYRQGELLLTMDKMKVYNTIFNVPLLMVMIYYYVKYYESSIAIYMFLTLLCNFGLTLLIFYFSVSMKRDIQQEKKDKFE